jgi:hypothetical protein
MVSTFVKSGFAVIDDFITPEECAEHLQSVAAFREHNELPEIHRPAKDRPLRYFVIDGGLIEKHFKKIHTLYLNGMNTLVNELSGFQLAPLENKLVGVNINIMPARRSSYRWHYDRTSVTAILYLNDVEGGETVMYPNYRILLKNRKLQWLQRLLDSLLRPRIVRGIFGNKQVVEPKAGRLVVMQANRCWHSVRPVAGERERINIILSYDLPGAEFPMEAGLDKYLYTREKQESSDPNYG